MLDFADFVLEAAQRLQRALVDDHAVAQQSNLGAALDHAVGDHAAGDVAGLGDLEDLANLSVADQGFLVGRVEQAEHQGLHVLGDLVDDAVVADVDLVALGDLAGLRVGAHVEADEQRARGLGQGDVGLADAADAAVDDLGLDLVCREPLDGAGQSLGGALHVGLDEDRQLLGRALADALHHFFQRAAAARDLGQLGLTIATHAEVGDFARARFALDHVEFVARLRRAVEAEDLDRNGRTGALDGGAMIVDQAAHAAPHGAGDKHVADLEGAALDQHGGHRTAARIELGFDDDAVGHALRIGLELEHFGLQQDGFLELVEVHPLGGRDLDRLDLAAQRLDLDFLAQQVVLHTARVGARLVHLVDGHDDRHARRLGVGDGFLGLRHDAVVAGNHQHDDVRHLGAARTHGGEGFVTRRIEEGDLLARGQGHLVGADMLRDAAGFVRRHVGGAQGVEQRGLAVIDMAHDRDHRRPRDADLVGIDFLGQAGLDIAFGDAFELVAHLRHHQLGGVGVDRLVDGGHHAHAHQRLDDVGAALAHARGEILHRDGLGDSDLAIDLLLAVVLVLAAAVALETAAHLGG